jgi:uncharacterized protein YlxW (UPF0749 family)
MHINDEYINSFSEALIELETELSKQKLKVIDLTNKVIQLETELNNPIKSEPDDWEVNQDRIDDMEYNLGVADAENGSDMHQDW